MIAPFAGIAIANYKYKCSDVSVTPKISLASPAVVRGANDAVLGHSMSKELNRSTGTNTSMALLAGIVPLPLPAVA